MLSFIGTSTFIIENAEPLAKEAVEAILQQIERDIPLYEKEQAIGMYKELLKYFGRVLVQENQMEVPDSFINWSKKNAEMQVASNEKISEIIIRYQPTRIVFTEILTRISLTFNLTIEESITIVKLFNYILDISLNETVYAFERLFTKSKEETEQELLKLAAPIVPVKEGVVVLPLIGTVDEFRLRVLADTVLPKISVMGINTVIVDFSGLLLFNSQVAIAFQLMGEALKLMGIQVISTGLRPDLAQVIVNSGIQLSDTKTFATVEQALNNI